MNRFLLKKYFYSFALNKEDKKIITWNFFSLFKLTQMDNRTELKYIVLKHR